MTLKEFIQQFQKKMERTPGLNESGVFDGVPVQFGLSIDEIKERSLNAFTLYIPDDRIDPGGPNKVKLSFCAYEA